MHSDAGTAGRRAREGQHALPHRRLAADERNLARCRHFDGSDPRAGDGQADAAGVARAGDRVRRDRRRLRHRLRLPVHQHDLAGRARTRRCRRRTTRASCSSGCSATAAAPIRRSRLARLRQQRSVLDSVTEEVAHLQGALPQSDRTKLTEYLDAIRGVERRIQIAEAAERSGAAARRSSRGHSRRAGKIT